MKFSHFWILFDILLALAIIAIVGLILWAATEDRERRYKEKPRKVFVKKYYAGAGQLKWWIKSNDSFVLI